MEEFDELALVVIAEENAVVVQIAPIGRGHGASRDRGKRPVSRAVCSTSNTWSEQPRGDGCRIAVEQNGAGFDGGSRSDPDAADPAAFHEQFRYFRPAAEFHAQLLRQPLARAGYASHTALRQPHPLLFHMGDDVERGR